MERHSDVLVVVFHRSQLNRTGLAPPHRRYGVPRLGPRSTTRDATGRAAERLVSALPQSGTASASLSGFARTSGFENYKVSGFANYSRPVLLAPQQKRMGSSPHVPMGIFLGKRVCASRESSRSPTLRDYSVPSSKVRRPSKSLVRTWVALSGTTVFTTPTLILCSHLTAPVFASSAYTTPFLVP